MLDLNNKNNKDSLYTYGRYDVLVVPDVLNETRIVAGYGTVNRETGIREFESTALNEACRMARILELHLREILKIKDDPSDSIFGKNEQPAQLELVLVSTDDEELDDEPEPTPTKPRLH